MIRLTRSLDPLYIPRFKRYGNDADVPVDLESRVKFLDFRLENMMTSDGIPHNLRELDSKHLVGSISCETASTKAIEEVLTAPPMMNNLSSSFCTHCTILLALCASAFRFACGPATQ
jgi:hypothetical protein